MEIRTEHLTLVLQTPGDVLARIEAMSPADRTEVSPDWLARVRASTVADPWTHGFSLVEQGSGTVVGSCGYKGPPDSDGMVEIAYGVDPNFQGHGYATEATRALVEFAFGSGQVRVVRAHTLPGTSASTRVLRKRGFGWVGEVVDPEDGLVWRWERQEETEPFTAPAAEDLECA
jgi:[ribosomal protein S5]-alanine N-acetyltransferase